MPDTNEGQRPTGSEERISNLDLVRGVAVLGILLMNVVMYGLGVTPYFNIDANGGDDWWDRAVGVLGEVLVDQKFMALFSMLFGADIVVFHERAIAKGARATLLSLWRNALLLVIGLNGLDYVHNLSTPHFKPKMLIRYKRTRSDPQSGLESRLNPLKPPVRPPGGLTGGLNGT